MLPLSVIQDTSLAKAGMPETAQGEVFHSSLLQYLPQPAGVPSSAEPFQTTAGTAGQGRGRAPFQMDRNSKQGSTDKIKKGRSDPQAVNNIQLT